MQYSIDFPEDRLYHGCHNEEGNDIALQVQLAKNRSERKVHSDVKIHIFLCIVWCVCVFFPFILDINGRTSRGHTGGRSHRILIHLLSAVRALIFVARRIQPFLSLVDREIEFCVLTN